MSVVLNPSNSLGFNRPLTEHVKRSLSISNHNAQPVAFKVKTTAPKLYCVRPNSGRVEPGGTVEVQVMLQAMKQDPPLAAKCKDKFLIQSTTITPEKETMPLQDMFNDATEDVHSQKIRVVYLPPEGQAVPEEDEQPHIQNVSDDHYETVRQHPDANGHFTRDPSGADDVPPQQQYDEHVEVPSTPPPEPPLHSEWHEDSHLAGEAEAAEPIINVSVHAPPSPPRPAPAPPAPVLSDQTAELAGRLHEAQAEIERLRNLISSMPEPSTVPTAIAASPTEVRRRRPFSDDSSTTYDGETEVGTYVEDTLAQPEGVPLQVVIIIALGVFITTYLFF
ncbi:VAMP-associated protein [Sparassis latifolia]|uniref:MSP domain-containing protein n=1 Tax=Sparassis crispa TaxID=139825 RepID=A0A401GS56_9APHY|nr:Uncharacterized protein SCP_0702410 [Sparassis crispa]GBE85055.1 Uncharacterized protein SCP_0702410 [Sparassis crispa]